jgi:prepilin-type N-terminal cleavage/methylation domain-containing protein
MGRRGFTLIELLVVICILSILIGLSVVAVAAFLDRSKAHATESLLANLSSAVESYAVRWGDFPPTSIADIGGRPPNDLNNGIETLAACLSSRKMGAPLFLKEDTLCNVDHDQADRNLTGWDWGTNELFEYHDYFGNVLVYFHSKDYVKPKREMTRYRFSENGEEFEVAPELHPVSKTFVKPGRFQIRSVGKDGKPGTADDLRPE